MTQLYLRQNCVQEAVCLQLQGAYYIFNNVKNKNYMAPAVYGASNRGK